MNDPYIDALSWDCLTWQGIQAIGMALAEVYPDANTLTLAPQRVAELVAQLPGVRTDGDPPDDFILSAIITAWIMAHEGDDGSQPYGSLA